MIMIALTSKPVVVGHAHGRDLSLAIVEAIHRTLVPKKHEIHKFEVCRGNAGHL